MSKIMVEIEYDESYGDLTLEEIENGLYYVYFPGGGFRVSLHRPTQRPADFVPIICPSCGKPTEGGRVLCLSCVNPQSR